MGALAFWKAVVEDHSNFLEAIVDLLAEHAIRYCVIGGVGVNAYAEPVVTLDLNIVVAVEDMERTRALLAKRFRLNEFEHSLNIYDPGSKLQVQIQHDPLLSTLIERAEVRDVMDLRLPVAAADDLLRAKVAAALDPTHRASKRQKDLADIARLVEAFPDLRDLLPDSIKTRLID